MFPEFTDWAKEMIATCDGLVKFEDFWFELTDIPAISIDKKVTSIMNGVLQHTGFNMAPDPRFHGLKASTDGHLVLFVCCHSSDSEPSKAFQETCLAIRLGVIMAKVDGSA
jgi:hypothetical protein